MADEAVDASLVAVHECWDEGEASVVISFLRANGIEAITGSDSMRSIYPMLVNGLGRIEVQVRKSDEEAAKTLLSEQEALGSGGAELDGE